MKTFDTKAPRHQEFFNDKPLGVPLCLGALVAIFISVKYGFFHSNRLKYTLKRKT
jgi:hypothetical protein